MPVSAFQQRFISFCDSNRERRIQECRGELEGLPQILRRWEEALRFLTDLYKEAEQRAVLSKALADPYFPLTMLRKLNVEEFSAESGLSDSTDEQLGKILTVHLLEWAEIFLAIRQDLSQQDYIGRISDVPLTDSAEDSLPEGGWCDYCGGCCEIRGGLPEFTTAVDPPGRWMLYFCGDTVANQRFCPFLFEYFATGRFFCAIYKVKPRCCWAFGRDECEFLKKDVARQRDGH